MTAPAPVRADGKPLTVSASSLTRYRECARAWWYEAVLGLVRPSGPAAVLGTNTHTALEVRVTTGAWPAHVNGYGSPVNIARAGGATEPLVERLHAAYTRGELLVEVNVADRGLKLGPLPFRGRIDLADTKAWEISDWKTTGRPAGRLSEVELARDPQLLLYAWSLWGTLGQRVTHHVLDTSGRPGLYTTSAIVRPDTIRAVTDAAAEAAETMARLAPVRDANEVPATLASCAKWGGCPHAARCPATSGRPRGFGGGLFDAADTDTNDPTTNNTNEAPTMSGYDLSFLTGAPAPAAAPAATTPPPAQAAAPAPGPVGGQVAPPDASGAKPPLDEAVDAIKALGKWPGDKVAGAIAEDYGATLADLRAAAKAAGVPVPDEAPAATRAPAASAAPTKAAAELAEDVRVALATTGVRGSEPWWAAWRHSRGVSRIGADRKAAIVAALDAALDAADRAAGDPPPAEPVAEVRTLTIWDAQREEAIAEAIEGFRAGHAEGVIEARLLGRGASPGAVAEVMRYAKARAASAAVADGHEPRTDIAEARRAVERDVAPPPAPNPPPPAAPAPTVAPSTAPAGSGGVGVLLVDALPVGLPSVPLRVYLAAAIGAVEAAEGAPIDLVEYGKGPAYVAARIAGGALTASPIPVVADTADKLTVAVLPAFVRAGWLVFRGVR